MKISNDISGNRTRDLPAGSAVPQLTAPTLVPFLPIFFLLALQPPLGVVFYSLLVGFSLLAYEVS